MNASTIEPQLSAPAPNRANEMATWNCVVVFYAIACGITWTLWLPLVLGREGLRLLNIAPSLPVVVSLGTVGPLIASLVIYRLRDGNWRAVRLLPRTKIQLLWLAFGPMLVLACFFLVFPTLISKGSPMSWHWHFGALAGIFVPMFNYNLLGGPLFEEFGWRGFLQPQLQRALPPWTAAICVGAMWAAWHFPLFLVVGWTSSSMPVFLLILTGLSLVMAFGCNASGQSVLVAILMHSAFNSSPRCLGEFLRGIAMREHPPVELLIAVSFLLVGTSLAILTRGRLASCPADPPPPIDIPK